MSTTTPLSFHDRQHITRLLTQESRVNGIYNRFVRSIAPEMRKWKDANNRNSVWVQNSNIEKFIDSQLLKLKSALETEIRNNQQIAWTSANVKNDELAERFISGMMLSDVVRNGMFARNLDGLFALQNRVDNGMNLSDRIWKITEQTKTNVELFLESGIATGRSAEAIGRDMRQMLHNPDKRFRRVRNEQGELVPSQPMKKYNPGRGVYRSARMNALRVAATETNMAYRVSDCERWQGMDFVLGYEVKRSRNGEPCEICDSLVGEYPKDFVFSGFHPFCICFAVPILMNHEDFADFLLNDDIPQGKIITDIPENAREWIDAFQKKADRLPFFVEEVGNNKIFFDSSGKSENIKAIEKKLDTKVGREMTFEEAGGGKGNRRYNSGDKGFRVNCQSCVVANELRRRGFDVTAHKNTKKPGNIPYELSSKTEWAWIDPKTGKMPKKARAGGWYFDANGKRKTKTLKVLEREFLDLTTDVGRYHIDWNHKRGNSGHIIVAEKLPNGKYRFYDPQTGERKTWAEIVRNIKMGDGINVLRVDNLDVNIDIIDKIVYSWI